MFYRKVKFWDGDGQDAPPVFHVDGVHYLHVKVCFHSPRSAVMSASDLAACGQNVALLLQDGGVMLVATTRDNVSPSLVLELLRRVGGIIKVGIQSACTALHTMTTAALATYMHVTCNSPCCLL